MMATFSDPIKSTALVPYIPKADPSVHISKHHLAIMQQLFIERSFSAQLADFQHLSDSWYGVETRSVVSELRERMIPTIPSGAGASVLVAANGEKPRHLGLGTTSVEGGQPIDINTTAVMGSGAKMFTGILSKVLEGKGVLSLQTKLSDVLEERHFAIFHDPAAAKNITLEMLLSHTSGLQFHADIERNEREGMDWDKILDGMCEEAAKNPKKKIQITGVPGDGIYAYSNQISLAAIFIEMAYHRAYKKTHPDSTDKFTYADILMREVLTPLGMSRTSFIKRSENVLRTYSNEDGIPKSGDADIRDPVHQPAGGLWSTAADIGKLAEAFAKALKTGEGLKSADGKTVLLNPEALEDLLRPRDVRGIVALGVDVVGPFFGKGGEISTYDFKFCFDRETGSYIISFCNFKNSLEFGGEKESGAKVGYINRVIQTLDEMHARFARPKTSSVPVVTDPYKVSTSYTGLPLHSCNVFYYGIMGIIGMHSDERKWVNWNGEILPIKQIGKNKFLIVANEQHAGKIVEFVKGHKGNPYILIETTPSTQKVINPIAFRGVTPIGAKSQIDEIETLKLQRNLPLEGILDAQTTYVSTLGARGALPTTVTIDPDQRTIKVSSQERLDPDGHPLEIPMTISRSEIGPDEQLNELWLIGNFMRVPVYQLKLSKQESGVWKVQVVDFASKEAVDTMLPMRKS